MPTQNVEASSALELQAIADLLAKSRKVVVITGAGISTNCGIPDFRSENGLYSLIQAQYDSAANAKLAQAKGVDNEADDIDDRPMKRRKVEVPAATMNLRSSHSSSAMATNTPTITGRGLQASSLSDNLPTLRRTRSTASLPATSQYFDLEKPLDQQQAKTNPCPLVETTIVVEDSTPPSSQASTASTTSSVRNTLPNLKGKDLFDSLIWSDPLTTSIFYMFVSSLRSKIRNDVTNTTATHKFIRSLRDAKRLVRNYTQNIDGLERREGLCDDLEKGPGDRSRFSQKPSKTTNTSAEVSGGHNYSAGVEAVYLHGSLDALRCSLCARLADWDQEGREETTLAGESPSCPWCTTNSVNREGRGRRSLAIGRLRPDIVLYGEEHPSAHLISPLVTHDLSLNPDILLILGTSLRVHGLKVMVREFAKAVRIRGGKVIFVNQTKPPESIWGDIIDYHVQWDCDQWVDDLRERRGDIWLPVGTPREGSPKEEKLKVPAKNPAATRQDVSNGAYCTMKIMESLGQLSGRAPRSLPASININPQEDLRSVLGEASLKRKAPPRPQAIRENKENGAYLVWAIRKNLRRLSDHVSVAENTPTPTPTPTQPPPPTPQHSLPLESISVNLPGRRRIPSQKVRDSLPSPPMSDESTPLTPRASRTKLLCGISALLSSPSHGMQVWRDKV